MSFVVIIQRNGGSSSVYTESNLAADLATTCVTTLNDGTACGKPAHTYTPPGDAPNNETFALCEGHYEWFTAHGANWERAEQIDGDEGHGNRSSRRFRAG